MAEPATNQKALPLPAHIVVLGLFLVWMLPGLWGHDPWKPDEASAFGVVYSMLRGTGWLVPQLAGEVVLDSPPLFYWVCALFAKALGFALPLHDAARFACVAFVVATVAFGALAARALHGPKPGFASFILALGCIGFIPHAHQLVPDLAMLAGYACALYGLSIAPQRPHGGGLCLGTGFGIVFLSEGPAQAAVLVLTVALLPILFSPWRGVFLLKCAGTALIASLPWWIIWPGLLHAHSPKLFHTWLWVENLDHLRVFDKEIMLSSVYRFIRALSWHTWPAWPLALWALLESRKNFLANRGLQLAVVMFATMFVVLAITRDLQESHALPLLVPLVLLASHGVQTLRRGAANALLWFSIMFFFLFALTGWFYWMGMDAGIPERLHRHLMRMQPNYEPSYFVLRLIGAALVTAAWVWAIANLKRTPERPVLAWTAGTTMLWALIMILFGNYMDAGLSYRQVSLKIKKAIPAGTACVGSAGLGASQRAMLHYFANLVTQRSENPRARKDCPVLLLQSTRALPRDLGPQWMLAFSGAREGDKNELYQLFVRRR
ncbi:MAG: glycosyltransferase family 39 protein [Betaproteobacteria bacterium]|nr:glycosyltransferase family 39 protein [Betaproteobacteria bacterium]